MPRTRDPYAVLGVNPSASQEDIQAAFVDLSGRFHPDRECHRDPQRFQEIQQAYELLSDPAERQTYDLAHGATGRTAAGPSRGLRPTPDDSVLEPAPREPLELEGDGGPQGDLRFRLVLSPEEAAGGGRYVFAVPMRVDCPVCTSAAGAAGPSCALCEDTGEVFTEHEVEIVVPPGIRDGQATTVELDHVGLLGVRLHLHVKIQD